jgi:hypothetical protein
MTNKISCRILQLSPLIINRLKIVKNLAKKYNNARIIPNLQNILKSLQIKYNE